MHAGEGGNITYSWIKQSTTYSVPPPSRNQEAEPIPKTDENNRLRAACVGTLGQIRVLRDNHKMSAESKVQKHQGPDELSRRSDEVVFHVFGALVLVDAVFFVLKGLLMF